MSIELGEVEALVRYPVKSMRGEPVGAAELDWHGIVGDRRLALRRLDDSSGFPWLSASRLPALLLFAPVPRGSALEQDLPTHVRTPEGDELAVFGEELAADIGRRLGSPVQMMHLRQGVFDEAAISVITSATIREIGALTTLAPDLRRFRPNIVIRSLRPAPFEEEEWVGGTLSFGHGAGAATLAVTMRDERCSMVNLDPDSARSDADMLKAIVRVKNNKAGVYGTITRRGRVAIGQTIFFEPQKD